jgi:YVTN family beta-propeller protein
MFTAPAVTLLLATSAGLPEPAPTPDGDAPIARTEPQDASKHAVTFGAPWERGPESDAAAFVFGGDLPEGDNPADVIFTPDGSTIIIAHRESRNLIMWDAATLAFIDEIPLPGYPQNLDISPDGTTAVVTDIETDAVHIIDLATRTITNSVPVGGNPGPIRIMAGGTITAVGITSTSEVAVINLTTASIERTISGIGYTQTFGANFETSGINLQYSRFSVVDNDRIVNADRFNDEVQFVNVRTGAVTRIPVDDQPAGHAVSGDASTLLVAHGGSTRIITVIDTATETVTKGIFAPVDLRGPIATDATGSKAIVVIQNAARALDVATDTFGPTLNTASINQLVTNFDNTRVFGVGFNGPVFDLASGTLRGFANTVISTDFGAASPTADIAVGCSTTFGDDLLVAEIDASPRRLAFQLSGPTPEGDRGRTVAVADDGSVVGLVNIFSDTLSIIDPATNAVTGWAPLGQRPSGVAITPDGSTAVVANLDSNFASVVDLATATSTNVPISRRASQVEISPDGRYAYLPVVADGDGVWRIDLTTNTVAGPKITTGNMGGVGYNFSQSSGIALSPDGSLLAVAGSFTDNVSLINTTTWTDLGDFPTGDFPTYAAFNADGTRLAVSNKNDDTVSVFDVTSIPPTEIARLNTGDQPGQLGFADDGRLFVLNFADDSISTFTAALANGITIPMPDTVSGLEINSAANEILVAYGTSSTAVGGTAGFAQTQSGTLRILSLDNFAVLEDIDLGKGPSDLDVSSNASVAATAAIIGDGAVVVRRTNACNPADLAEPFGQLTFGDVGAFLTAFNANDPAADLAAPFGQFTFGDVGAFITAFDVGCP